MVAACLLVAFLPLGLRERVRARLLDLHARIHRALSRDPGGLAPDATLKTSGLALAAGQDVRSRLLEAEVLRLRRALLEARTARQVVALDPKARLIPAEVLPLAGKADLVKRMALARGTLDGVRPGLPVLADGALVGRVAEVTATTCEVRLITDPRFSIRASVPQGGQDVEGILRGDGSALLSFEPALLDPAAAPPVLSVGEAVHCSRASLVCGVPALLGVILDAERRPGDALLTARIQPALDLDAVRRVVILLGDDEPASS